MLTPLEPELCVLRRGERHEVSHEPWTRRGGRPFHRSRPLTPTPRPFAHRTGFLFVGSVHEPMSPNADSLQWFIGQAWPLIEASVEGARFDVAGENHAREIGALANGSVRMLGPVADLTPVYDSHRIFVAPTRFAAGLPHKVHEAAAHGLPVVATL